MGLEPAIFERLRNSSLDKFIGFKNLGGLSFSDNRNSEYMVAERSVSYRLRKLIRSDNASMSKKQCENHCHSPRVPIVEIIMIGLYSP